jgi:hypothetical protein
MLRCETLAVAPTESSNVGCADLRYFEQSRQFGIQKTFRAPNAAVALPGDRA